MVDRVAAGAVAAAGVDQLLLAGCPGVINFQDPKMDAKD